ncbi:MAG: hypothetical protein PHQ40_07085 [Anaerolineaceae bacterium]|nr:hypothetical protein [Anaerolineaceae bacterium]
MEALELIRSILEPYSFNILEVREDKVIISTRNCNYFIPLHDIYAYQEISGKIIIDPETAIFYPGYYEHYIQEADSLNTRIMSYRRRDDFRIVSADSTLALEISSPSTAYMLSILHNGKPDLRRYSFSNGMLREGEEISFWTRSFRGIKTIKVIAEEGTKYSNDRGKLRQIAEAGLFHFAFGNSICFNLASKFERNHYRLGQRRREAVQFPRRLYTSDLLSYYNLALSSDSLMLGFIALYKILEYFFPSATENALHKRMTEKIVSPDFTHTKPKQLRDLAKIIRQFDQRMDEQRILTTVIDSFFNPSELIEWVIEYEKSEGTYYSVPQKVLGETFTLDLNPEKLSSSLAKRIYHTRNVLVHNKEDEPYRFIPFSGEEAVLTKEIPIVLYIAEQIIIKTGKDL